RRTVEELATAGICAMSIEDTVLPRPYGPSGKPTLSSIEEGVGKMKAALSARQDKRLVIAGRTSALAIAGVDEAIKRARAYEAAGVDAVFLAGGVTAEAIEAVSEAIRIPIITGGAGGRLPAMDARLSRRGMRHAQASYSGGAADSRGLCGAGLGPGDAQQFRLRPGSGGDICHVLPGLRIARRHDRDELRIAVERHP